MKLKPCPFCGAAAEIKKRKAHYQDRPRIGWYRVHCTNLEGSCIAVCIHRYYETEEDAAAAWNWRDD